MRPIPSNVFRRACGRGTRISLTLLALLCAPAAWATEGALGRPITGVQITPYAGIIPPEPGFQWQLGYIYYDGKISASKPAPIAGQVSLGLEAEASIFTATGIYIWPTAPGKWNFASMLTVPYIDVEATAALSAGGPGLQTKQSASSLYDLYFAPVIVGYHFDQVRHLSFGLYVYAPTADYDPDNLANAGLNVWTVSPTVAYTQLFQKGTLEFSVQGAVDVYSKNDDTDYKNGEVGRAEMLLVKRTASGWGFGGVLGGIYQLNDDTGPTADQLGGFKGRSAGIGPVVTYSKKWKGGEHVDLTFRYVSEFSVKNRFEGEPVSLMVGIGF